MKKPLPVGERPAAVVTTMNQRRKHSLSEEKRIADHSRPRWWVHAHINTRAKDKPGTLAALVADSSTRLDFESYVQETRTMRARTTFANAQHKANGFSFSF